MEDITPIRNFINTLQNITSRDYNQLLKKEHVEPAIQCFQTIATKYGCQHGKRVRTYYVFLN